MREYILCCSCFKMDKKASEAFCVLFPDKTLPDIVKGRDRLSKLASALNQDHIKAISKLSGKFAYYVVLDVNNKIVLEYNLLTGKRIA